MAKKVLFVDDHEDTLRLVEDILTREGYHVVTASNRRETLSALESDGFDLILLDVLLPGDDGRRLCQEIREKFQGIRIAYVTVLRRAEYLKRYGSDDLRQLGVADYIKKPFDKDDLLNRVSAILSQ